MIELIVANGAIPDEFVERAIGTPPEQNTPAPASTASTLPTTELLAGFSLQHIHIDAGTISALSGDIRPESICSFDATGCIVLPGFIDIHVHGAVGHDTMDASVAALGEMARFFATHGVTGFLPTTMSAPPEQITDAIHFVGEAISILSSCTNVAGADILSSCANVASADISTSDTQSGARILGTHVEGPFISPRYPGAQPAEQIRPPDLAEFEQMRQAGPIRMITLAPEEPDALKLISVANRHGIASVVGHTNATFDGCQQAFAAGANQATHTYNAMSGLHHRNPGTLGAVLSDDRIYAQLIADNVHVHPAAMKILARCKGVEQTILITDAMRAVGLPPGNYELGGQSVSVQDGECRLADGTLAGSILTMEAGLANFIEATGIPLCDAWPVCSRSPAQALGLAHEFGSIARGYHADLVVLDQALTVVATIVGGHVVYLHQQHRERYTSLE